MTAHISELLLPFARSIFSFEFRADIPGRARFLRKKCMQWIPSAFWRLSPVARPPMSRTLKNFGPPVSPASLWVNLCDQLLSCVLTNFGPPVSPASLWVSQCNQLLSHTARYFLEEVVRLFIEQKCACPHLEQCMSVSVFFSFLALVSPRATTPPRVPASIEHSRTELLPMRHLVLDPNCGTCKHHKSSMQKKS